jgi:hypothetical protein
MFGRIIFSQNAFSVSGDENMSLWLPILTTAAKKRRA